MKENGGTTEINNLEVGEQTIRITILDSNSTYKYVFKVTKKSNKPIAIVKLNGKEIQPNNTYIFEQSDKITIEGEYSEGISKIYYQIGKNSKQVSLKNPTELRCDIIDYSACTLGVYVVSKDMKQSSEWYSYILVNKDKPYGTGDVDGDGHVTSIDLQLVLAYCSGIDEISSSYQGKRNADVNLDTIINIADAGIIQKYLNGIIKSLPYIEVIPETICGDADLNGKVEKADAELVLEYCAGLRIISEQEERNADVNADGKLNTADAVIILRYLDGIIKSLPYIDDINKIQVFGDINLDSKVTEEDVYILLEYLENKTQLNSQQKLNADVNLDNVINEKDIILILQSLSPYWDTELPCPILKGRSEMLERKYGDIDNDGKIHKEDVNKLLSYCSGARNLLSEDFKYADVNFDGIINTGDAVIILRYIEGIIESLPLIEIRTIYGDVNLDGNITMEDADLLGKYVKGIIDLNINQLRNADVNFDGIVNTGDAVIILRYIEGMIESLPLIEIKTIYGDVNLDGNITMEDADLLEKYVKGIIDLNINQLRNADVDLNMIYNIIDVKIIKDYCNMDGKVPYLPYSNENQII